MAKVQFGLKNIHLFPLTETTDPETGVVSVSYGTAVAFPGAVNLNLSKESEDADPFYADDGVYYLPPALPTGYSGDLEVALLPNNIRLAFLNYIQDTKDTLIELGTAETKYFAMTCENQTDGKPVKKIFYKCAFGAPDVEMGTIEDTKTPQTTTLPITILPTAKTYTYEDADENEITTTIISGMADENSDSAVYAGWHSTVHEPVFGE